MGQLVNVINFLPCFVSVIWLCIYTFRVKNLTQKMMMGILVMATYYFMTYAYYISPQTDYRMMARLDMINIPVILTLAVGNLIFVCSHHSLSFYRSHWHYALYIPIFILTTLDLFLYAIIGVDDVARFVQAYDCCGHFPEGFDAPRFSWFYHFSWIQVKLVLMAYALTTMFLSLKFALRHGYRLGDVGRFFFRGNESNPTRAVCFLDFVVLVLLCSLVVMGRSYIYNHPVIGCTLSLLLSVALFCLYYVEYMIGLPTFSLSSLSHVQLGTEGGGNLRQGSVATDGSQPTEEAGSMPVNPALVQALRQAMDEGRVYLDPELSIISLAERLGTNRTTLSQAIAQTYGMNFRQLMARLRIEEAQRYMLQHPEAKQDEVALECGFTTAQAFNQKFKEVVGDAPRLWLARQRNNDI